MTTPNTLETCLICGGSYKRNSAIVVTTKETTPICTECYETKFLPAIKKLKEETNPSLLEKAPPANS